MAKKDKSLIVDTIPEGKEDEYLTLEQSDYVRNELKKLLPYWIVFIAFSFLFSLSSLLLKAFNIDSLQTKLILLVFAVIFVLYFFIKVILKIIKLNKYLKEIK